MNKFEFTDLNRFLVSLGLALILGSAALAWLFFREPFDLNITVEQLGKITPLARRIILDRQNSIGTALTVLPIAGSLGVVLGVALFSLGLARWIPFQRDYEKIQELTRQKQELELRQMSAAEIIAQARSEVTLQQPAAAAADLLRGNASALESAVADYLESENALLDVLAERLPADYELLPHQRAGLFTFDALIRARTGKAPEYIVEFKKLSPGASTRYLSEGLRRASEAAAWIGFGQKTQRVPLVVAVAQEIDARFFEEATRLVNETADNPTSFGRSLLRLISPSRLKTLSARDVQDLLDTSRRLLVFAEEETGSSVEATQVL